jgi:hypothetical protein
MEELGADKRTVLTDVTYIGQEVKKGMLLIQSRTSDKVT